MNRIILLFVLFSLPLSAQSKYYIFFRDKGFLPGNNSETEIKAYSIARKNISQRALLRRAGANVKKLIDFDDLPIYKPYIAQLTELGIEIKNKLKWFNAVTAYINDDKLAEVKNLAFVKKISPVLSVKISYPQQAEARELPLVKTDDHKYSYGGSLVQLELSDIPVLHDLNIDGSGVRIGIMDTGFDWKNQRATMNMKVVAEYDFIFGDSVTANEAGDDPSQHNHGTLTLSTIAAFDPGRMIGAAFNAEFVLAKTEDIRSETHVEEDNYAAALEWFESLGVDVATSSLGYSEFDPSTYSYTYEDMDGKTAIVTRAAEKAFQKGMVTVTSAGNEGNTGWHYITAPGDGFNTITVGAVNLSNIVASFSGRGPTADGRIKPDVCAMGVSVYAADARIGDYNFFSGTSLSAPITAGVCALLLSKFPYLQNTQLRQIILESGDNVKSPDNDRGYGLVSALKAVTFPHIKEENGKRFLVKMFYDENGIDKSSVKLNLRVNGAETEYDLSLDLDNTAVFQLDAAADNSDISFSFSYKDGKGIWRREPSSAFYSLDAGGNLVKLYSGNIIYEYLPEDYKLLNAYPNPFNGSTNIQYELPRSSQVQIAVYDVLGREIKIFNLGETAAGFYTREIDFSAYSTGVYIVRFRAGDFSETLKIMLIK